jgi:hypothetical protein
MFLRHEGFLGALGAFMSYDKHSLADWTAHQFVERFPMGAPYAGGKVHGPPIRDLNEKVSSGSSNYAGIFYCLNSTRILFSVILLMSSLGVFVMPVSNSYYMYY